jgi:uncharacterized membrane protein
MRVTLVGSPAPGAVFGRAGFCRKLTTRDVEMSISGNTVTGSMNAAIKIREDAVRYFGAAVASPAAATVYIAYLIFSTIDRGAGGRLGPGSFSPWWSSRSRFDSKSGAPVDIAERWLTSVPLAKLIYTSIRDLINAFVGDKKRFDRPVAVMLAPGSRIRALGFVTRDGLDSLGLGDQVAVYFPQSYNFAGNLVVVPRDQVEPLTVSTRDLMTFIVWRRSGLGIEPEPVGRSSTLEDERLVGLDLKRMLAPRDSNRKNRRN